MLRDSNRAHAAAAKDDETGAGDVVGNAPTRPDGPRSLRLAKLAHELKTPLSAIVAAAEIMRDERLGPIENPRYRSYSADIYDSARHALMVIGNMLGDGAQALDVDGSACLPPMVFAEIAVADIVESCVSSMRPLAERAGLALTTEAPERLPHVIADATAVRQIVLNLLNNAVKFTRPGGAIRLALRYWPDGPLEIEIADTGRGMTAEEIARAGPAAADQGVSRREGGGFGIGLPLVGALARANGAGVSFVSVPGEGTRVVVAFGRDRVVPV
jgi:signal transduction histidine kinase